MKPTICFCHNMQARLREDMYIFPDLTLMDFAKESRWLTGEGGIFQPYRANPSGLKNHPKGTKHGGNREADPKEKQIQSPSSLPSPSNPGDVLWVLKDGECLIQVSPALLSHYGDPAGKAAAAAALTIPLLM